MVGPHHGLEAEQLGATKVVVVRVLGSDEVGIVVRIGLLGHKRTVLRRCEDFADNDAWISDFEIDTRAAS